MNDFELFLYKGEYDRAEKLIEMSEDPVEGTLMHAKLLEKRGEFEHSTTLLASLNITTLTPEQKLAFDIQQLYNRWRQVKFTDCQALLDEYQTLTFDESLDHLLVGKFHNIAGLIYWSLGRNSQDAELVHLAISHHHKAAEYRKHSALDLSFTYNNLGNAYLTLKEFDQAETYYLRALEIREKGQLVAEYATTLRDLGRLYLAWEKPLQAKPYLLQALTIREDLNNLLDLAKIYYSLAEVYLATDEHTLASRYLSASLKIYTDLKMGKQVAECESLAKELNRAF